MSTSINDRVFDPFTDNELYIYKGSKPAGIIVYEPKHGISRLKHVQDGDFVGEKGTLVVSVAGNTDEIHENLVDLGNSSTKAFYGAYYGKESRFNKQGRVLPATEDQTLKAADLMAACKAVEFVAERQRYGTEPFHDLKIVVIKTASTNLFNGIPTHIWKWKRNGWLNSRDQPVASKELWLRLDSAVQGIETHGVRVCFWLVEKEHNRAAKSLAGVSLQKKTVEMEEEDDLEDV